MANRKLSLLLFSAKPSGLRSIPRAHFIASPASEQQGYALVCQSQPLMTFRSYGLPIRCPACGVSIHFKQGEHEC
jgi:hypothetical protein